MSEIKSLAKKLCDELDSSVLENLNEEQLLKLRKELNPYGKIIDGEKKYINISYSNLREEYIKKFMMTALIGFLNRMCDEWRVPIDVPVVPVYDYFKNPKLLEEKKDESEDFKKNREWMEKRIINKNYHWIILWKSRLSAFS